MLAWIMNLDFAASQGITPPIPLPVITPATGSAPGFVPRGAKRSKPYKRKGQVFGEEYPISPFLETKAKATNKVSIQEHPFVDDGIESAVVLLLKHLL